MDPGPPVPEILDAAGESPYTPTNTTTYYSSYFVYALYTVNILSGLNNALSSYATWVKACTKSTVSYTLSALRLRALGSNANSDTFMYRKCILGQTFLTLNHIPHVLR